MNTNLAYQEEPREELLNGKIFMMSSPSVNHYQITFNIVSAFQSYLKGKTCRAFGDGIDVYLTEEDRVVPDAMIVCTKDSIQKNGIHGAPDLIVEVLSPSTAKNDKGYKRELYEKVGIKEYWIVDPVLQNIEVYLLVDGKYRLDEIYRWPEEDMTEKEKGLCKMIVPISFYNDFSVSLDEIFYNLI